MRTHFVSGSISLLFRRRVRCPRLTACLALAVALGSGLAAQPAAAATRVDLHIDEPQPQRTVAWPITTGVPFPRGELRDAAQCRLLDDTGAEQLLQARATAHWDAQRSSIRWLTIDFIAQPGRTYALEFGPDVTRRPVDPQTALLKLLPGEPLRVQTGAITVEFSARQPATLGAICADLNGNGTIEPAERIASGASSGDHYYLDQAGQRFSSAKDGVDRVLIVEADGPVRACIRIDGYYTGPKGERIVAYRTRYHFFAGLALVKLVDEFKVIGSTRDTRFQDIGLALDLAETAAPRKVTIDASGARGAQPLAIDWQPDTASLTSHQSVYRHYGNPEYYAGVVETGPQGERVHAERDRVGEWMQVADSRGSVTGSLRWFWQQFPKAWTATPGQLTLHLWTPRAGQLDFGSEGLRQFFGPAGHKHLLDYNAHRAGVQSPIENFFYSAGQSALKRGDADGLGLNKHHEIFLHFAPASQSAAGAEYATLAAEQPLALASGAWNCGTDVFGPLLPRPNASGYEPIIDRIFDLSRYAQDAFGDYGWYLFGAGPHYSYQWDAVAQRHVADPRRFEYHTYQKETQLWWCYLRSGERKFYDWAIPSENHWVDIAVSHAPTRFQSEWRGGERQEQTLHWPVGDWSIDSPLHYVRHHDTGEAWLRGASQYWGTYHRTLESTSLAYYLTGDERFNDVIGYWKNYWSQLAGKNSASTDLPPWHREQTWFQPTAPGQPTKTWAEMIRDYAPYWSGSRHQQTLFFNLSTLYEHTWDPVVKQVLDEYAAAFLDPDHRIGIWRNQQNDLPAHADAPTLTHYWSSALWKYTRATQDPRMPELLKRYFDACYAADPFREDLGGYSAVHLGYAYYFTRDPKHLRPAQLELHDLLQRNSPPLSRPEELGPRIYNPYEPVHALTATPRLAWALDRAQRDGISPLPPPLRPQRTAIALLKQAGVPITATLWGYDRELRLLGPDGQPFTNATVQRTEHASEKQPFDRVQPDYLVYLQELAIPATAPAGFYVLAPQLELAVLQIQGAERVCWNAASPVSQEPNDAWSISVPAGARQVQLESAAVESLQAERADGTQLTRVLVGNRATWELPGDAAAQIVIIRNTGKAAVWWRLVEQVPTHCWISLPSKNPLPAPGQSLTDAALADRFTTATAVVSSNSAEELPAQFVDGRFGKGVQLVPGRELRIPDHLLKDGAKVRLSQQAQGTIEFWLRRQWDERLVKTPPFPWLSNGALQVSIPRPLPLQEWAHVAVVWYPAQRDATQTRTHVYVNGHDSGNYRNVWWDGYGDRPPGVTTARDWLEAFVSRAPAGVSYALDELRISSVPRYADTQLEFGRAQTFNPTRFAPPAEPFQADPQTLLLFRFDGDLRAEESVAARGVPKAALTDPAKPPGK